VSLDVQPTDEITVRVSSLGSVTEAGHVARMNETSIQHLRWKTSRKEAFGRAGHRWEGNMNINFRKPGCEGVDWIQLAQDNVQWRVP